MRQESLKSMLSHPWRIGAFCCFIFVFLLGVRCSDPLRDLQDEENTKTETNDTPISAAASLSIYIPEALKRNNFDRCSSTWCWARSRQSDHFIVFWGKGYGDNDPNSTSVPAEYRVNIDDLLAKSESFYQLNVNQLKFAELGIGQSKLDTYKMMIFLYYQTDWLATGSGYDDVIGALWISPNTCQPVGSTIAHEIGHSFQYQVFCDLGNGAGFRYGFGGNGGNAFWEQTAQFQAHQSYPKETFTSYDFSVYTQNYHRHLHHEFYRYASYFIHEYWIDKHGQDFVGRLWREAQQPEDPIQAYMRINSITTDDLNAEVYDAASKFVTWDLPSLRTPGADYIGRQTYNYTKLSDGTYQVAYDRCPGTTGYNVIRLNVPAAGTNISADFTGMVNASGYNQVSDPSRAGWRYGYVALLNDGQRVYSPMYSGTQSTVSFTVPNNCAKLWFVVTGAPNTYAPHPWDDNEANDDQWPYKVKFTNTIVFGDYSGSGEPHDDLITYNVTVPYSATEYATTTKALDDDVNRLVDAFVLSASQITAEMGNKIKLYGVESNGTLNGTMTANNGHWFNSLGNVCAWGDDAKVFSEFDGSQFVFTLGQYPGHVSPGEQYTVSQALVYEYEPGQTVQVTFVFNITIQ